MVKWKYTLDVKDSYNKAINKEITTQAFCQDIATKLMKIQQTINVADKDSNYNVTLDMLVNEFIELSTSTETDEEVLHENFNNIWNELYDWSDLTLDGGWNGTKMCWVKSF